MARIATTPRPPVVAALWLFGAVCLLAPAPSSTPGSPLSPMGPRPVVVVAGEPRGDLYVPPAVDPWMILSPEPVDPLILRVPPARHAGLRPVSVDDLVSGFLGLVTGRPS